MEIRNELTSIAPVTMPVSGPIIPPHKKSIVETIYERTKSAGKATFLINEENGKKYSYYDLHRNASSIAVSLQKIGVAEGTVVVSLAENSFELFSFAFGVYFSKGILCALNYTLKADEIRKMLEISKPTIIFADEKYVSLAEEAIKNIGWDIKIITAQNSVKYQSYQNLINEDTSKLIVKISEPEKHVMCILFTSGTTGVPKGVMLRDQGNYNTSIWCFQWPEFQSRYLLTSPMFWISNLWALMRCIYLEKTVIIPGVLTAENVLKCIIATKPEVWFTGAAILLEMCQLPHINDSNISSLQTIYAGGSSLHTEQRKLIVNTLLKGKNMLRIVYGSTEAGLLASFMNPIDIESPQYNSIGKLTHGVELKVVDINNGKELGPNERGEFCVRSACMMAGYMNGGIKDDYDSEGWWHMGDCGYYDEEGFIYYIAPSGLEEILVKHPGVHEAAVVGKPHAIDGEWPTAFIIKNNQSTVTEKELNELVNSQVPDSKKLRGGIHFVDDFPRSAVGKILKTKLLELLK